MKAMKLGLSGRACVTSLMGVRNSADLTGRVRNSSPDSNAPLWGAVFKAPPFGWGSLLFSRMSSVMPATAVSLAGETFRAGLDPLA